LALTADVCLSSARSGVKRTPSTRTASATSTESVYSACDSGCACPLCRLQCVPGESLGSKQAYRVTHQPVSVVSQCSLIAWLNWLASGDHRRLTGSGSALETCSRRCAIQMAALLYLLTLLQENLEDCRENGHVYLLQKLPLHGVQK